MCIKRFQGNAVASHWGLDVRAKKSRLPVINSFFQDSSVDTTGMKLFDLINFKK